MKIVHVNTCDYGGGAAIAALRHTEAMRDAGLDACMLVLEKKSNKDYIYIYKPSLISQLKRFLCRIISSISFKLARPLYVWNTSFTGYNIIENEKIANADIIYLHCVTNFVSYGDIANLLKNKKKIVLFLHDMEFITAGCHYSFNCDKYMERCQECCFLQGVKFISKLSLNYKIRTLQHFNELYVASPSKWLMQCSKGSSLFAGKNNLVVRNVVDTNVFKANDKIEARASIGLNPKKQYILFVACDINSPYKGWKYLKEAFSKIEDDNTEAIVIGRYCNEIDDLEIKVNHFGFVQDDLLKVKIYSAATMLVIPSTAENFPNVVLESMACGTPVVGFRTGGIAEQIRHKYNGFLVNNYSSDGLYEGIEWINKLDVIEYHSLCKNTVNYINDNFSYSKILEIHKPIIK